MDERRFVLPRDVAERFAEGLAARGLAERAPCDVRTTYLDTDDLSYYRTWGAPVHRRIRLREYAAGTPARLTGVAFLELKETRGQTRRKARIAGDAVMLLRAATELRGLHQDVAARFVELAPEIASLLAVRRLAPRVTTWYHRRAWSADAGRVRVTLDDDIRFCAPAVAGRPGDLAAPIVTLEEGHASVVEIKTEGAPPDWLRDATAGLVETVAFSKFRAAMAASLRASSAPPRRERTVTQPIRIPILVRCAGF